MEELRKRLAELKAAKQVFLQERRDYSFEEFKRKLKLINKRINTLESKLT